METGTAIAAAAFIVSAAGAINSLLKTRIEGGTATSGALQALNKSYREEIDRLEKKLDDTEAEWLRETTRCQEQIKREQEFSRRLQETIGEQAQRIGALERRVESRTRPRAGGTDG